MDFATQYLRSDQLSAVGQPVANRNMVEFFVEPVQSDAESEKAGRPIFHDVEMIRIIIPGDHKSIVVRRATHVDRDTYPRQYEAFRRNEQMAVEGTPVEHWNVLTRSQVATLKAVNIYTMEQLAGLDDGKLQEIGILGSRSLRRQAQVYLSQATDGAEAAKLVADNERQQQQIAQLQNQLTTLAVNYEALMKKMGSDASAVNLPQSVHLHPAQQVASAPSAPAPAPLPTVTKELPTSWRDLPPADLIKLARSLSPAPVKNKADAIALITEIEESKVA